MLNPHCLLCLVNCNIRDKMAVKKVDNNLGRGSPHKGNAKKIFDMRLSLKAKRIGTVNCNKEQYFHIECTLQINRVQLRLNINPPFLHFKVASFGATLLKKSISS